MAIIPEALFGAEFPIVPDLRAYPREDGIRPGKLAQFGSSVDLPNLTPLFFDDTNFEWNVWGGQTNEVNTITSNATPATAGTFTITVNSVVSATIAFDATAAVVQAALEAMSNIAPGDVVAVQTTGTDLGDASAVVTLTWGGAFAGEDITISIQTGGLTGNPHVLATTTAGGADLADGSDIDGFLWAPVEPVTTSTTGELIVQVFRAGLIHRDDIPVPTGESQADLDQALLGSSLREKGIDIQGLAGVH